MNKKILPIILAILVVSIAGTAILYVLSAKDGALAPRGTMVFQTDVTDVKVTLVGPGDTLKTGVIGDKKELTFTGLPDGEYQAIATKDGYTDHQVLAASIHNGGRTTLPIYMMPVPSEQPLQVCANPNAVAVKQGDSGAVTVTVRSLNNYAGAVTPTCTQLPAGITATFSPASVSVAAGGTASLTLTLKTSATTAKGIYPVNIDLQYEQGGTGGLGPLVQVT